MERSASLFGLIGIVLLAFGALAAFLVGPTSAFCIGNVGIGLLLLLASVVFGFENVVGLVGRRSTRYGAGAAVYSVLFVVLVAGLNYLGTRHHHRWDVTEAGVYTLAPQSRSVVQALGDRLTMTAFVEGGIDPGLTSLLESYRYAAPGSIEIRMLDPDREPALVEQMKITTAPSVHLQHGSESFVVTQPSEEAITNGIIRVTGAEKNIVYVAQGFGQPDVDDRDDPRGYAAAKLGLEQENYEVRTFVWPATESLPEDASAVVIPGFGQPLTPTAVSAIDAYLERGGRVLAMIGPRQHDERFVSMLGRWGVKIGNDVVVDQQLQILGTSVVGLQPLAMDYGTHPITRDFRGYTSFPETRTIEPDTVGKPGLEATALVKTGPASWAESDVDQVYAKGTVALDAADRRGPLTIATAVTATLATMGVTVPEGGTDDARLVVIGTQRFADNEEFTRRPLNADLFLNAVGWLVGQSQTVSVRSRSVRSSRAELTPDQATRVFFLSVFIIPELLVLLGVGVWWRRRSR